MRQFEQIGDTQSICATLYGLFNFIAALLIDIAETGVTFCFAFPNMFRNPFVLGDLIGWIESFLLDQKSRDSSGLKRRHDRIDRRPQGFCSIVLSDRFLT